jgi:hypothetical protein
MSISKKAYIISMPFSCGLDVLNLDNRHLQTILYVARYFSFSWEA